MSVSSGYVHISLRNRNNTGANARQQPGNNSGYGAGYGIPSYSQQPGYRPLRAVPPQAAGATRNPDSSPMTAPTQVVAPAGEDQSTPVRSVANDNVARGFVLYVGLDEEAAAAQGTSLTKLVQDIRAYAQSLVPNAQSYAAVALAPADATGSDIDVVRNALGDPTAANVRVEPARSPQLPQAPRPTGVLIDLSRREVHLDGDTLNLTFKEFELLNYLVENGQRTVAREELLSGLWRNADEIPNERTIDVHIRRLRSKLGRLANTVRTVRGQGYRFYEHPEVVVWAAPEYSI